jgi:hypothetical protein
MPIMTDVPTAVSRPPLPHRPVPHEKTPDRTTPSNPRPHPRSMNPTVIPALVAKAVDREVGPRRPGAIYQNVDGRFEVLVLVTDPREAAQLLRRDSARWAVIVRDTLRADAQPFAVGSVWTVSDHLIREGAPTPPPARFAPAA